MKPRYWGPIPHSRHCFVSDVTQRTVELLREQFGKHLSKLQFLNQQMSSFFSIIHEFSFELSFQVITKSIILCQSQTNNNVRLQSLGLEHFPALFPQEFGSTIVISVKRGHNIWYYCLLCCHCIYLCKLLYSHRHISIHVSAQVKCSLHMNAFQLLGLLKLTGM